MIVLADCSIPTAVLSGTEAGNLPRGHRLNPVYRASLFLEDGKVQAIQPADCSGMDGSDHQVIDLQGSILLPRFLDAHVHLDKAHTWDRAPNHTGTFAEAIETLAQDKNLWTEEDLYRRADYALRSAWAHGTTAIRTHVDTGLPWAETSHKVMADLRRRWAGKIELQTVSLCGVEAYATEEGPALADLPLRYGASAIGGMPVMNPHLDEQLDALLRLAKERQCGVDLHVDESGDPQALTLLAVAEAVLRNSFPYPVTCGHCCSLAVQAPETRRLVMEKVLAAGIHIISLPLCNLYLQDRASGALDNKGKSETPFWRGITLMNEWMRQGTVLACASDNVRDAFYAYGDLDAFEVLLSSIRCAHLDNQLERAAEVVTRAPATVMELPSHGRIAPGLPARFIAFEARSFSEWLSRPSQPRRLFEHDQWIEAAVPRPGELDYDVGGLDSASN